MTNRTYVANQLLSGIPENRLIDLRLRHLAGRLTAAEGLALRILEGVPDAVGPAIDAAQEEFGNGTYRVPVRVVSDRDRMRVVLSGMDAMPTEIIHQIVRNVEKVLFEDGYNIAWIPAGVSLQVFEVNDPAEAGVAVEDKG